MKGINGQAGETGPPLVRKSPAPGMASGPWKLASAPSLGTWGQETRVLGSAHLRLHVRFTGSSPKGLRK